MMAMSRQVWDDDALALTLLLIVTDAYACTSSSLTTRYLVTGHRQA